MGYNGEGFPPLWNTTKEDFFRCGIQQRTISRWQTNFFLSQEIFLALYPTPQPNPIQCTVSQKNLPHCIQQRRRFYSILSHNGRYFPPLWDTTEEVFFQFGIQRKRFFPLWDTMEKNYTRQNDILNLKCLSLSSNKNLGKICYLNS